MTLTDIMSRLREEMTNDQTEVATRVWLGDDVLPIHYENDTFAMYTEKSMKRDMILNNYGEFFKAALLNILGKKTELKIYAENEIDITTPKTSENDFFLSDENFTFESFVVGASNKFAHAAAVAVSNRNSDTSKSNAYNPLFIYGGSGLGKTHLLRAIAHRALLDNPELNVIYIKGDDFTNELITAIQEKKNVEFRNKYRLADILLLDDIQFLSGRESTQLEFFHTFNSLYDLNKQIVMTSDRPPKEIQSLEIRLRTRFEWGLLADIQPPDYETRMAIVKNKAKMLNFTLMDQVMDFIATNVKTNVRQLEGTVKKIHANRELLANDLDIESIQKIIGDISDTPGLKITSEKIIEIVSKFFSVSAHEITSDSRKKEIVLPRQIAMYLCRELTTLSLPDIGKSFGGRDHTTVIHSVSKIEDQVKKGDSALASTITDIKNNIIET